MLVVTQLASKTANLAGILNFNEWELYSVLPAQLPATCNATLQYYDEGSCTCASCASLQQTAGCSCNATLAACGGGCTRALEAGAVKSVMLATAGALSAAASSGGSSSTPT